jgi:hypothetical protein
LFAAIRMLFDWRIVGQVVGQNSAPEMRGPKHVVTKGKAMKHESCSRASTPAPLSACATVN